MKGYTEQIKQRGRNSSKSYLGKIILWTCNRKMWEAKYPGWLLGSTMGDSLIAIPFTGTRKLQEKKPKKIEDDKVCLYYAEIMIHEGHI